MLIPDYLCMISLCDVVAIRTNKIWEVECKKGNKSLSPPQDLGHIWSMALSLDISCQKGSWHLWTCLVVQWLRLHAPNAGGPGSIPGQGTRSHMPQLRVCMPQLKILYAAMKIPCAATKTQHRQIYK